MKIKINYFLIPLFALAVAVLGGQITNFGMEWYGKLDLPDFTPPGYAIGAVWTVIFALSAISALIVYNKKSRFKNGKIMNAFMFNGILNIFWSILFFGLHSIGPAIWEAAILGMSVVGLIILIWPRSRLAALLLFPYAGWVAFATYLTFVVWTLNN